MEEKSVSKTYACDPEMLAFCFILGAMQQHANLIAKLVSAGMMPSQVAYFVAKTQLEAET